MTARPSSSQSHSIRRTRITATITSWRLRYIIELDILTCPAPRKLDHSEQEFSTYDPQAGSRAGAEPCIERSARSRRGLKASNGGTQIAGPVVYAGGKELQRDVLGEFSRTSQTQMRLVEVENP